MNKTQHQAYETTDYGPVAQLVSASPCHGEGRGFEPRQDRKFSAPISVRGARARSAEERRVMSQVRLLPSWETGSWRNT